MPTINGITFTELVGSCQLDASQEGVEGKRILDCDWADRKAATQAILGKIVVVDGVRNTIMPPDTFPGYDNLEAESLQMEGVGLTGEASDGGAAYDLARFTVTYKVLEYSQDAESDGDNNAGKFYDTEEIDYETSYVSVPGGCFVFDDGTPILNITAIPIELIVRTFTKRDLATLPTISTYINCVNNAVWRGAAVGNVLFTGAKSTKKVNSSGKTTYDVRYTFKERNIEKTDGSGTKVGWNYAFNPTTKEWEVVNPLLFPVADFEALAKG